MNSKSKLAAIAALCIGSASAHAAPITVDFSITSTTGSSANYGTGIVGSGFFTFDNALIPTGGTGPIGNSILGVNTLDLAFSWFGTAFDETTAKIATLTFANGALTDWWIGGNYIAPICGLMRYSCVHSAGAAPDFMVLASSGGSLNDGVRSGIGSGYGTVNWSVRSASVPEPSSVALFGLGLIGVGFVARKKRNEQLNG